MKLYITAYSPYARMTRILAREKNLLSRIEEIVAQTRVEESPYYTVNPSGRVPYLQCDNGFCIEDSHLILSLIHI